MAKKRRKISKYNRLQKAVAKNCKNSTKTNAKAVQEAKEAYIKDAVNKGKSLTEARRTANKADTCTPFKKKRRQHSSKSQLKIIIQTFNTK